MSWQTNGRRRLLAQDYDETAEDLEIGASEIRPRASPRGQTAPIEQGRPARSNEVKIHCPVSAYWATARRAASGGGRSGAGLGDITRRRSPLRLGPAGSDHQAGSIVSAGGQQNVSRGGRAHTRGLTEPRLLLQPDSEELPRRAREVEGGPGRRASVRAAPRFRWLSAL